jgi:predicted ATPase
VINLILQDIQQNARLVSIVGPGGVGKTTVALAVADRAATVFKDGVWLVDLSLRDDPSWVTEAISDLIRSSSRADDEAHPLDSRSLRNREMLLVLDNCEHVIGTVAICADRLLSSTKGVKLMATSREPISIRGERVRRLYGLRLPPEHGDITATEALAFPAVQLFSNRASEECKSFRLDDSNAPIVSAICRRLDGHALAIERVAQRVGTLGIAGMLDHIDKRFHIFDGYHQGPARHRTLTATVDTSYAMLTPSEQATMRYLSTFADTFNLESACFILAGAHADGAQVVEDIASLVAKSLLSAELCNGEMHYRQGNVTRAFAMEKLVEHGELEHARSRQALRSIDALGQCAGPPATGHRLISSARTDVEKSRNE